MTQALSLRSRSILTSVSVDSDYHMERTGSAEPVYSQGILGGQWQTLAFSKKEPMISKVKMRTLIELGYLAD